MEPQLQQPQPRHQEYHHAPRSSLNNNTNNTGNKMISRKNKTPNPEGIGKENSRNKNKTTTSPKQSGVSATVH